MKKTPLLVASAIGLTLVFYMAAYYWLPGDPPSTAMVGLFAAVALGLVWGGNAVWSRKHGANAVPPAPKVPGLVLGIGLGLMGFPWITSGLLAQTPPVSMLPTIRCSADPSTVQPGESSTILAAGASAQNRPLRYSFSATAGQISGNTSTATLSTVGAPPGPIAVTCTVVDDLGQTASTTILVSVNAPASPAPPPPRGGAPPSQGRGNQPSPPAGGSGPPALDRVTGTAVLLPGRREAAGFGLYSYALLFHPPSEAELPRYRAFLRALVDLPAAEGLAQYVSPNRINVTSIPLMRADPAWDADEADAKVAFILSHYDYARSAAIRASLATNVGTGPVLLSVLHPINPAEHPLPVLVQDMTRAQATLMSAYVQAFVSQAAQERFWEESALSQFALGLRNSLEVAAAGLNLSQTAVDGWIKIFK